MGQIGPSCLCNLDQAVKGGAARQHGGHGRHDSASQRIRAATGTMHVSDPSSMSSVDPRVLSSTRLSSVTRSCRRFAKTIILMLFGLVGSLHFCMPSTCEEESPRSHRSTKRYSEAPSTNVCFIMLHTSGIFGINRSSSSRNRSQHAALTLSATAAANAQAAHGGG